MFDVGGQRDERRKWIQCFNGTHTFSIDKVVCDWLSKSDRCLLHVFAELWNHVSFVCLLEFLDCNFFLENRVILH